HEACCNSHFVSACNIQEAGRTGTVRDRLRKIIQLRHREISNEPVTRYAAFREDYELYSVRGTGFRKPLYLAEVGFLVGGFALELDGCDANGSTVVGHRSPLITQAGMHRNRKADPSDDMAVLGMTSLIGCSALEL